MKKLSQEQEQSIAKDFKGKMTPNSGGIRAPAALKGDINAMDYKIECKITTKDNYRLKFKDLLLIRKYAIKSGRIPLFIFEFSSGKYANKYVCVFEKNDGDSLEGKSVLLHDRYLFTGISEGLIVKFKFMDKEVERNINIYDYNYFLERIKWKEQ